MPVGNIRTLDKFRYLAFHPQFLMSDLPRTSRRDAEDAYQSAISAGLKRVRIGNVHFLW